MGPRMHRNLTGSGSGCANCRCCAWAGLCYRVTVQRCPSVATCRPLPFHAVDSNSTVVVSQGLLPRERSTATAAPAVTAAVPRHRLRPAPGHQKPAEETVYRTGQTERAEPSAQLASESAAEAVYTRANVAPGTNPGRLPCPPSNPHTTRRGQQTPGGRRPCTSTERNIFRSHLARSSQW